MKAEASGADFIEGTAFESCWFNRHTSVRQQNFNSTLRTFPFAKRQLVATHLDGESGPSAISVAHNVGEGFIHRADDGASVSGLKVHNFGGTLHSSANQAQRFRIALQLKFQKHFGLCLGPSAPLLPVFDHPSTAHSYTRP